MEVIAVLKYKNQEVARESVSPLNEYSKRLLEKLPFPALPKQEFDPKKSLLQQLRQFECHCFPYFWFLFYQSSDLMLLQYISSPKQLKCQHYLSNMQQKCGVCCETTDCQLCHDEIQPTCQFTPSGFRCGFCRHSFLSPSSSCPKCGKVLYNYSCKICNIFTIDRGISHCVVCGSCHLASFDHCETCSICRPAIHSCKINEQSCSICQGEFNAAFPQTVESCGHAFHQSCITKWKESSQKCPVCKKVLIDNLRARFMNQLLISSWRRELEGKQQFRCGNCGRFQNLLKLKGYNFQVCAFCDGICELTAEVGQTLLTIDKIQFNIPQENILNVFQQLYSVELESHRLANRSLRETLVGIGLLMDVNSNITYEILQVLQNFNMVPQFSEFDISCVMVAQVLSHCQNELKQLAANK